MSTNVRTSLAFVALLLTAACDGAGIDPEDDIAAEGAELVSTRGLLAQVRSGATPNIATALDGLGVGSRGLRVRAVVRTESGFQVYRCTAAADGAARWALRTPLAHLDPLVVRDRSRLVGAYHYRSDFGGLLSSDVRRALGLIAADGTEQLAPVWDMTFSAPAASSAPADRDAAYVDSMRREIVAGRVLAQDTVGAGNIPAFLIEIRGRAVVDIEGLLEDAVSADGVSPSAAITSAEYMLRWNLLGGLAPAADSCDAESIGRESQSPYRADYYFLDVDR